MLQIPHVFPFASLMNPDSPQLVPHEFFIFQYVLVAPTNKIAWLMLVPQLLNTPDEYLLQFDASTQEERG